MKKKLSFNCEFCSRTFDTGQGISAHIRFGHPDEWLKRKTKAKNAPVLPTEEENIITQMSVESFSEPQTVKSDPKHLIKQALTQLILESSRIQGEISERQILEKQIEAIGKQISAIALALKAFSEPEEQENGADHHYAFPTPSRSVADIVMASK